MRASLVGIGAAFLVMAACGGDDTPGADDDDDTSSSSSGTLPGADGGSSSGSNGSADSGSLPTDGDGIKNGTETDIDCGGPSPSTPRCDPTRTCASGTDCTSQVCTAGTCAAPSYTDLVKNGTETDVDCGGDLAHACAVGLACLTHTDCASNGCDFTGKCALRASCVNEHGGATCLAADGSKQSCCTAIDVPVTTHGGDAFTVDKFVTTAGRMRAFLDRVDGNVRAYIAAAPPAWWDARWTPWLPSSFTGHANGDYVNGAIEPTTVTGWSTGEYDINPDGKTITPHAGVAAHPIVVTNTNLASAWSQVAGGILFDQNSQGCFLGDGEAAGAGHPTYLVPKADAIELYGDHYDRWMSQEALDERPINCTNWPMLAALCAFDGGTLISKEQYDEIYDNDGWATGAARSTYPWGSPPALTCTGAIAKGICCTGTELKPDGSCKVGGGTWHAPAGYKKATNPHVGGRASLSGVWTLVGPGMVGGSTTNPCPDCVEDWVNWKFNYQDDAWIPDLAALGADEYSRRVIDQSYFISIPGAFPKGASHEINGDRVQDIAGLMFEATLPSAEAVGNVLVNFGNGNGADDVAVQVPKVPLNGGSFEGHPVGSASTYNLPTKYGKMTARCVH